MFKSICDLVFGFSIQMVIARKGGRPCHDGMIEFLVIDGGVLISAAADGCVRFWDLATIVDGDIEDVNDAFIIEPQRSVTIGASASGQAPDMPVRIRGMLRGEDNWMVLDEQGYLWRLSTTDWTSTPILEFHSGAINGALVTRSSYHITAGGADGRLRCWDPHTRQCLFQRQFGPGSVISASSSSSAQQQQQHTDPTSIHCISPLPESLDIEGIMAAIGFGDGVVRIVQRSHDRFVLLDAAKPHTKPVVHVVFSLDGTQMATVGAPLL